MMWRVNGRWNDISLVGVQTPHGAKTVNNVQGSTGRAHTFPDRERVIIVRPDTHV